MRLLAAQTIDDPEEMYAMYPYATIHEHGQPARAVRCPTTDPRRARRWARWLLALETRAMRHDGISREIVFRGVHLAGKEAAR